MGIGNSVTHSLTYSLSYSLTYETSFSAHQIQDGKLREVNCSLEASSWKLNIFRSSLDRLETKRLLASDLVVINDPETRNNLSISTGEDGKSYPFHRLTQLVTYLKFHRRSKSHVSSG
jgi:hypothetical protein